MIEELKDFDRNIDSYDYKEPLLEYAEEVANHFWGTYDPTKYVLEDGTEVEGQCLPSIVPHDFACRYLDGKIDKRKEASYIESKEVQDTIKAFGLDSTKFWYMCLMVKDYVESRTKKAIKLNPTHREELVNLVNRIDQLEHSTDNPFEYEGIVELSVKIGKEKRYSITDGTTIGVIRFAIAKLLEETPQFHNTLDSVRLNRNEEVDLPLVYHIYMFNYYISWFMKDIKGIKGVYASKDKSLLISRMIYILGISDDKRYYQEYTESGDKLNFLKQNLSKYKNIDIKTISNTYFI